MTARACYHCGLPIPPDVKLAVRILGEDRPMCCGGCQAVSSAIVDSGLSAYYRHRDALPSAQRQALPDELIDLGLFDSADFQATFVTTPAENEHEATLLLEGITCAACVWLNEQHVARQPGVLAVSINYATRRARVRWDSRIAKLSQILAAIREIGYRAYPYDPKRDEALAAKERRSALWRLFVAGFGTMQIMMYALPEYVAGEGDMTVDMSALLRWASLILTLPVVFYSSAPFFERAVRDIGRKRLGMDVPVSLGIAVAFGASVWATVAGGGPVYFDSVAMFVFFLLCGRYLEMLARQRAVRGAEELSKILPATAERLANWPQPEGQRVDVSRLVSGDVIRVKPGEVIAADGEVIAGTGNADESLLTGESAAVQKAIGSAVIAGAVNGTTPLIVRVSGVGESTRLAGIRHLMERASSERPRIAVLADRYAARFVAFVLMMAAATAIVWWHLDPSQALWITVSVLVVSCPCALSLATPVALTVATAAMGREGVLVTRAHAIESLAQVNEFLFDKTGTLTDGHLMVDEFVNLSSLSDRRIKSIILTLEADSEHRVAAAVQAASWQVGAMPAADTEIVTGEGVRARIDGAEYRFGRRSFVEALCGERRTRQIEDRFPACSVVYLARSGELLAAIVLSDSLRKDAAEFIEYLRAQRMRLAILSGDSRAAVAQLGARLGFDEARGELLPEEKFAYVAQRQREGQVVAMVGDGVNDGPVLAQAHVSVAMGEGTELARNQADIVLLGERFAPLRRGHALADKCVRIIRQNLLWAVAYNLLALPAAMAGWVTPWMAGIGMSASSLVVIMNALRIPREG